MLNLVHLQNLKVFMERAQATGKEAIGWAETYFALEGEIRDLSKPPATGTAQEPEAPK